MFFLILLFPYIKFCDFAAAKIRISEQNAKRKYIFFILTLLNASIFGKAKDTDKRKKN